MTSRDAIRRRLTDLGLVDDVRTARHWIRSRGGASDRRLIETHLSTANVRRLHLGCGTRALDGWLNSDFSPRSHDAIRLDAAKRLPFDDSSFEYVYSEHMIEHLARPDTEGLLAEISRVLQPGGRVRIATPDLDRLVALFRPAEQHTADERRYIDLIATHSITDIDPTAATAVRVLNNNMRDWGHQFLFDFDTLRNAMAAAGLTSIERFELQQSNDPMLAGLANETRMPPGLVAFETMTFEATAP
jgi:predicted SAM-dependent methyltransferase